MNLLTAFYFAFEADVSGVEKGAAAGDAAAKKLKDTIDKTDMSAEKLAENFVKMAKNAGAALAAVFSLGALKTLVNDTAAHTTAIALQARALGMSTESLSSYQAAIISMGGTAEQATATIGKLRDGFIEVARFGTMGVSPLTMAFQSLGASAQTMHEAIKDPTIALSAIADRFAQLGHTQQLFLGQKMGLDQGTIALLAQGRQRFDEIIAKQKELHAVTEEQARASMKYTIAQKELGLTYEGIKRQIAQELLPAFTWITSGLDRIITYFNEHKAVAIATFTAIGIVIGAVLLPPLVSATAAMWALIAPVLLAAAPFIALGAAIGLVVDDIEKFMHGQNSMIGEIVTRWPVIGQTARAVAEIVQMSWQLMLSKGREFFTWLGSSAKTGWDEYKKSVSTMVQQFEDAFPKLASLGKRVFGDIREAAESVVKVWLRLVEVFQKIIDKITGAPKAVLNWIGKGLANMTGGHYDPIEDNPTTVVKPAPDVTASADVAAGKSTATGREISQKLVALGWTPEQAAGIAGNAMRESSGNAHAENSLGMYGLFQWDTTRRANFAKWAGHDIRQSTLDEQLKFFTYETTKGTEQSAGRAIRATTNATDAAIATAHQYERYGDRPDEDRKRVIEARQIMLDTGRQQVAAAQSAPLATPGAVPNTPAVQGGARIVNVGDISVHTAATTPDGIGQAVKDALRTHINNAIDQHDDGIAG